MIPYGKQSIDRKDIEAVIDVLKSDFITQGTQVPKFEDIVSNYVNSKFSVAVNSGTSALHIACLALGLKPGDTVWTVPNTFVASANCALYCGAKVDFVDIDPQTYNLSVSELEKKLVKAKQENKLPKILIPVAFAGQSCDMEKIMRISEKNNIPIIEDAAHAVGSVYKGKKCGSIGNVGCFSFFSFK